jgi:hypothetical protein
MEVKAVTGNEIDLAIATKFNIVLLKKGYIQVPLQYLYPMYMQGGSTLAIPIGYMQGCSTFAICLGYMQGGSTQGGIKKARTEDKIEIPGRKVYLFTVVVGG